MTEEVVRRIDLFSTDYSRIIGSGEIVRGGTVLLK